MGGHRPVEAIAMRHVDAKLRQHFERGVIFDELR
jgi:hypothetical protein